MKNAVLLTGATSGIGKHTASLLVKNNFHVFATARKAADLASLEKLGASPLLLDLTDPKTIPGALAKIPWSEFSAIHLINNAGVAVAGPVELVEPGEWQEQFAVNFFGLICLVQAMLPHMRNAKGKIINISSISGLVAAPYLGPYAASKFALEAVSDSLRREIRQFGIPVVLVEPGPVQTPIWDKGLRSGKPKTWPRDLVKLYVNELEGFERSVEKSAASAVSVALVSEKILAILRSPHPRHRYVIGTLATKIQAAILPLLPSRFVDWLIAKSLK